MTKFQVLQRCGVPQYWVVDPERYVEDEVKRALDDAPTQFERGPRVLTRKGTRGDDTAAFVVEDGSYLSARWPGDAYLFAKTLITRLAGGSTLRR